MVTFINKGNTCYFNVVMQVILHMKTSKENYGTRHVSRTCIQENWREIKVKLGELCKSSVFDPTLLFRFLRWNEYFEEGKKHDAQEALLYLIGFVREVDFRGLMIECMTTINDPYERNVRKTITNSIEISVNHPTLEECLGEYFQTDEIDAWVDSKGDTRRIIKFTNIDIVPNNLIILLRQAQFTKKRLQYPTKLDLGKWCISNSPGCYSLSSVVIHEHEHYYAYCKEDGAWAMYNDECRRVIHTNSWMTLDPPYLLHYTKID